MDEDMNKKDDNKKNKSNFSQVILVIFIVIIMMFLAIGVSFSSLQLSDQDEKNTGNINSIIATNVVEEEKEENENNENNENNNSKPKENIEFRYEESLANTNMIKLYGQEPISDNLGMALQGNNYVFEFKLVFNKNAEGIKYDILCEKLPNSNLPEENVKLYLVNDGETVSNVFRPDSKIKTFNEFAKNSTDKIILYSGVISKSDAQKGYKNFVFKMWLSEDTILNELTNGKEFSTKIGVIANK